MAKKTAAVCCRCMFIFVTPTTFADIDNKKLVVYFLVICDVVDSRIQNSYRHSKDLIL